jgi:hypothetical protein
VLRPLRLTSKVTAFISNRSFLYRLQALSQAYRAEIRLSMFVNLGLELIDACKRMSVSYQVWGGTFLVLASTTGIAALVSFGQTVVRQPLEGYCVY